jgi:hypothetical protein
MKVGIGIDIGIAKTKAIAIPIPIATPKARCLRLFSEQKLHADHVEPPAEFQSDAQQAADMLKIEFGVQGQTATLIGIDGSDKSMMTKISRSFDRILKEV